MNAWDTRRNAITQSTDYDPLTTIPMIELGQNFEASMYTRIRADFDRHAAMNIIIIDPYFGAQQVELVIELFASLRGRNVQIITNLDQPAETSTKQERGKQLAKVKQIVVEKGLFNSFSIWKTDIGIHDRILFSPDEGCSALYFCLGASLNSLFKSHSYICRVTNTSFKHTILKLYNICQTRGYEISYENADQ